MVEEVVVVVEVAVVASRICSATIAMNSAIYPGIVEAEEEEEGGEEGEIEGQDQDLVLLQDVEDHILDPGVDRLSGVPALDLPTDRILERQLPKGAALHLRAAAFLQVEGTRDIATRRAFWDFMADHGLVETNACNRYLHKFEENNSNFQQELQTSLTQCHEIADNIWNLMYINQSCVFL